MKKQKIVPIIVFLIFGLVLYTFLSSVFSPKNNQDEGGHEYKKNSGVTLNIISGSENKLLEPILQDFAHKNGFNVDVHYKGSVDIMLKLKENVDDIDGVWPASSVWLQMGANSKVKHRESIMRSPVVFGVKKEIATKLGWTGKSVSLNEIFSAIEQGRFTFAMTNATQSNSGLSGYLEFLHAFAGSPSQLTEADVNNKEAKEKTSAFLKKIDKSSGSSGWLKEKIEEKYDFIDSMMNYEALFIELNRELVRNGKQPLQVIYPKEGVVVADSPLAYINNGNKEKEEKFLLLQQYLLSPETQKKILDLGRRTGLGLNLENNSTVKDSIFNQDWGIKKNIGVSEITYPKQKVIETMLEEYQLSLRKPSLTVYALDISGSMQQEGIGQLKQAMATLLKKEIAKKYLLQASNKDITIVIPFNSAPENPLRAQGNKEETLNRLYMDIMNLQAGGGTDIYEPMRAGLEEINKIENISEYFPSIILMTDGQSEGQYKLSNIRNQDIPVFAIMFGDADKSQLEEITTKFNGRVFDGRKNLINAFRKAKGYN